MPLHKFSKCIPWINYFLGCAFISVNFTAPKMKISITLMPNKVLFID